MKKIIVIFMIALAAIGLVNAASVTPVYESGNPTCSDLGFTHETKFDPPNDGTKTVTNFGSITLDNLDGDYFDWTSTFPIMAVISKGGPNANVFYYTPDGSYGDTVLVSPTNPTNGKPYGLSHVTFCYEDDNEPKVPEFGTISAGVALLGAAYFVNKKRKKN
ncbi:MAG: hypothetical protein KKF44_03765 [Nanoarchaeota archaeon]|nr:hypothetical protein [Nanoarchaeota archaeon]